MDMPPIVHWFIEFELYVTLVFVLEDMPMFENDVSKCGLMMITCEHGCHTDHHPHHC